jgi:hypothetical protein
LGQGAQPQQRGALWHHINQDPNEKRESNLQIEDSGKLTDLFISGTFAYEKILDDGSKDVITGKIIGYGAAKPAELGDLVKVFVKTNFKVEPSGVLNWLRLYGITSHYEFQTSSITGLKSDIFEVELILKVHIPEYLPMYGQKVQIYYPGIPRVCNRCYVDGHLRRDCQNQKKDWVAFIAEQLENGLNPELIGSWSKAVESWKKSKKQ